MHHRAVRAAIVAAGLIGGVGGTAALADAASSTQSAKPSATPPARSAKPHDGKDCPNMGGDSSSGARYGAPGGSAPQPSV
jgi:hypothetical protein